VFSAEIVKIKGDILKFKICGFADLETFDRQFYIVRKKEVSQKKASRLVVKRQCRFPT